MNVPIVTYWEGAVRFDGICNGIPVNGNRYVELYETAKKIGVEICQTLA